MHKIKEVLAVIHEAINVGEEDINALKLHCPNITETATTKPYKGVGFIQVIRTPTVYVVTTVIRKNKNSFTLPVETVKSLWNVIKKYPLNKSVKTKTVAEQYCNELKITRFTRKSGTFRWAQFFGTRTEAYFPFYYSLKVLQHKGLINYHKKGKIERILDDWKEEQTLLQ